MEQIFRGFGELHGTLEQRRFLELDDSEPGNRFEEFPKSGNPDRDLMLKHDGKDEGSCCYLFEKIMLLFYITENIYNFLGVFNFFLSF